MKNCREAPIPGQIFDKPWTEIFGSNDYSSLGRVQIFYSNDFILSEQKNSNSLCHCNYKNITSRFPLTHSLIHAHLNIIISSINVFTFYELNVISSSLSVVPRITIKTSEYKNRTMMQFRERWTLFNFTKIRKHYFTHTHKRHVIFFLFFRWKSKRIFVQKKNVVDAGNNYRIALNKKKLQSHLAVTDSTFRGIFR